MKLNRNFIKHTMDGQTLIVPTSDADFHGLIRGNKTVEVIVDCLERGATEEEIVNTLCERFDGDREMIRADVADVIRRLKEIGVIDD